MSIAFDLLNLILKLLQVILHFSDSHLAVYAVLVEYCASVGHWI